MNVPMVDVGPVRVRVNYRLVLMQRVMPSITFFIIMLMSMVLIMLMGMRMSKPFMPVGMLMDFPVQ